MPPTVQPPGTVNKFNWPLYCTEGTVSISVSICTSASNAPPGNPLVSRDLCKCLSAPCICPSAATLPACSPSRPTCAQGPCPPTLPVPTDGENDPYDLKQFVDNYWDSLYKDRYCPKPEWMEPGSDSDSDCRSAPVANPLGTCSTCTLRTLL